MRATLTKGNGYGTDTEVTLFDLPDPETGNIDSINWKVRFIDKANFYERDEIPFDLFEHINAIWWKMPADEQREIFQLYRKMDRIFIEGEDLRTTTEELISLVVELYTHIDLVEIRKWVDYESNIIYPQMPNEFKADGSQPGSRERTYIREDYCQLVAFAIALRAVLPVWGEYITRFSDELGNRWKEYGALSLLNGSSIMESPAMQRLDLFVRETIPPESSVESAVLAGLSSTDFQRWILALVVVRRLALADVRGLDPTRTLAAYIYTYIRQKAKGNESNFAGVVREKIYEGDGRKDSDNKLSRLESIRYREAVSVGDLVIMRQPLHNPEWMIRRISPDIPLNLLHESLESVKALSDRRIEDAQVILTQWVVNSVVPARSIRFLKKDMLLVAMAVAQALLWHWGFKELAGLVTARATDGNSTLVSGIITRNRIGREQLEVLNQTFIYSRSASGRKSDRPKNSALVAVERLDDRINQHEWIMTLPESWVVELSGGRSDRRFKTPPDIKTKLCDLIIHLLNRK